MSLGPGASKIGFHDHMITGYLAKRSFLFKFSYG